MLGYFTPTIIERPVSTVDAIGYSVVQVLESDLSELESLLAADGGPVARLREGDVCLVARVDARPAGVLRINFHGHIDTYLGLWSKPSSHVVYYNQLQVATEYRRQGIARSLVLAAIDECARRGREILRAAVFSDNPASSDLHQALEFKPTAVVRGARAGALTIRLPGAGRRGSR